MEKKNLFTAASLGPHWVKKIPPHSESHRADVLCYLLRVAGMINLPQENQKAAFILGET